MCTFCGLWTIYFTVSFKSIFYYHNCFFRWFVFNKMTPGFCPINRLLDLLHHCSDQACKVLIADNIVSCKCGKFSYLAFIFANYLKRKKKSSVAEFKWRENWHNFLCFFCVSQAKGLRCVLAHRRTHTHTQAHIIYFVVNGFFSFSTSKCGIKPAASCTEPPLSHCPVLGCHVIGKTGVWGR